MFSGLLTPLYLLSEKTLSEKEVAGLPFFYSEKGSQKGKNKNREIEKVQKCRKYKKLNP